MNYTQQVRLVMLLTSVRQALANAEHTAPSGMLIIPPERASHLAEALALVEDSFLVGIPVIDFPRNPTSTARNSQSVLSEQIRTGPIDITVSSALVQRISTLQTQTSVSDEVLAGLHVGERDAFSRLPEELIRSLLDEQAAEQLSVIEDTKLQLAAMRWTLRGLRVDLAIRKVLLQSEREH